MPYPFVFEAKQKKEKKNSHYLTTSLQSWMAAAESTMMNALCHIPFKSQLQYLKPNSHRVIVHDFGMVFTFIRWFPLWLANGFCSRHVKQPSLCYAWIIYM